MSKRKFKVGDRAWMFDHSPWDFPPWDFAPYRVVRIEKRSYVMAREGIQGDVLTVSFVQAERKGSLWHTDQEREGFIWMRKNRHHVTRLVSVCDDVTILRKIAELIGWKSV